MQRRDGRYPGHCPVMEVRGSIVVVLGMALEYTMKHIVLRIATAVATITVALGLSTGLAAAGVPLTPADDQPVTDQVTTDQVPTPVSLLLFGKPDPATCLPPTGSFFSTPCLA